MTLKTASKNKPHTINTASKVEKKSKNPLHKFPKAAIFQLNNSRASYNPLAGMPKISGKGTKFSPC
jgi:hypothetical protein